MSMRLKFHGVRGSRPTHKRSLLGHGGNSTSFEILVDENFYLFVDGGSGLVPRGREIAATATRHANFHFLITHTHWDHILGFPYFEPLYDPTSRCRFYASKTSRATFNELFFGMQRVANLPVPASAMAASISFETIIPAQPFFIEGKVKVNTFQLNHQGVTLGYRLEYQGASVCIITDNAPIDRGNYLAEAMALRAKDDPAAFERSFNEELVAFLRGAHTVVFDTHFTEQGLKADWGHSTPERALAFCQMAGVKRLVLFHHAPEDDDEAVNQKVKSVFSQAREHGIEVVAAREGDEWPLR